MEGAMKLEEWSSAGHLNDGAVVVSQFEVSVKARDT